tara:strand:+ start:1003 stop:1428 length:426 start_codon:yes stop_codon:yes gene_type:complete
MRASEIRAKLVTAIEAAPVDDQASRTDVFTHLDIGTKEIRAGRDRLFVITVAAVPLRARQLFPSDNYSGSWDIVIMYADSPQIEDRICKDIERVSQALEKVPGENADINTIDIIGGPIQEFDGRVTATLTAQIGYRLTAGV